MDHEQQADRQGNQPKDNIASFLQYRLNAEVAYLINKPENAHLEGTALTKAITQQIVEILKKEYRLEESASLNDEDYYNLMHPIDKESGEPMDLVRNAILRAQKTQKKEQARAELLQ